jgi:hypothetical protein
MNVEQYIEQELNIKGIDLMGDDIPLDSDCGSSCKHVIDTAKAMCDHCDTGNDIYDCDSRYAFIGHIVSAFGPNSRELRDFLEEEDNNIPEIASHICQCYIFG